MNYENLLVLVKNKRSFRRFRPDAVPEGIVKKVLEVARHVSYGGNAGVRMKKPVTISSA